MDKSTLRRYFQGKLRMALKNGAKHECYAPVSAGEPIELFLALRLSRGGGSCARTNQKGIADVLCMSLTDLEQAATCHLSASVAYLGMSVQILRKARMAIDLDPVVYRWDHTALALIEPLLSLVTTHRAMAKPGRADAAFLEKLAQHVTATSEGAHGRLLALATSVSSAIATCRGAAA